MSSCSQLRSSEVATARMPSNEDLAIVGNALLGLDEPFFIFSKAGLLIQRNGRCGASAAAPPRSTHGSSTR